MKCAMLVAVLLTTVPAFPDEKPAKEPADLVKLRKAYEAKVEAVVEPITTAYLKKLDEMKKAYGAKGDLESAQAVQKEIESMASEKAKSPIKRKSVVTIVGKWDWPWGPGNIVEFMADGNGRADHGDKHDTCKWKCLDRKTRKYQARWQSTGAIDWMLLSADGTTLVCKNSGENWTAQRLPANEEK